MADLPIEQRLNALEQGLQKLAAQERARGRLSALRTFLLSNWTLITFMTGILIALYVKYQYGIDYFENQRNAAMTKEMSEYYRELGDKLLGQQEWEDAERAYRQSTQIYSNNVQAQFG